MKTKTSIIFFLLLLPVIFNGCQKPVENFNFGETATIDFSKEVVFSNHQSSVSVLFDKLLDEGRCHPDHVCFWAGEVKIQLKIDGVQPVGISFGSSSSYDVKTISNAENKKFIIEVLSVEYGKVKNYGREKKYVVKLKLLEA